MKKFFKRFWGILKELMFLIKKEKAYFLAPILLMIVFLAFLVYHVGPSVIFAFIYAGV